MFPVCEGSSVAQAFSKHAEKKQKKKGVIVVLALALVAALAFWYTRPPEVQEKLREDAANLREEAARMVDDATKGTPLAGSGNLLRSAPTPPPASVMHPSTNPGTLGGPVIRCESDVEGMLLPDGSFRKEGQRVLNRVLEDAKLKKDFVEDLAEYIVNSFAPDAQGGRFTKDLQSLNSHCGTRMNTETGGGRTALLRYVFQPTMLRGLYHLYLPSFLETLQDRAKLRCSKRELEQFYTMLTARIADTAKALTALLAQSDLSGQLKAYEKLAEACEAVSAKSTVALFDLDQLIENKASTGEVQMMQQHVDELGLEYKSALESRDRLLRPLLDRLHSEIGTAFDDDTLLFLALWVQRRLEGGGNSRDAVKTSVTILEDLATRVQELAEGRLPGDFSLGEKSADGPTTTTSDAAALTSQKEPKASLVDDEQLSSRTSALSRRPVKEPVQEKGKSVQEALQGKKESPSAPVTHELPAESVGQKEDARDHVQTEAREEREQRPVLQMLPEETIPKKQEENRHPQTEAREKSQQSVSPAGQGAEEKARPKTEERVQVGPKEAAEPEVKKAEEEKPVHKEAPVRKPLPSDVLPPSPKPELVSPQKTREEKGEPPVDDGLPQTIQIPISALQSMFVTLC